MDAKLPSNKIQFARSFQVEAGKITELLLDFEGDRSLVVTGNGEYIFKPVVKLTVPVEGGKPGSAAATDVELPEAPEATETPGPTETPEPTPTSTATPEPTPEPTPTNDPLGSVMFLDIIMPQPEPDEDIIFTMEPTIVVAGWTRVDAAVTVGDQFLEVDENGRFESTVDLVEGPNRVEVLASVASGEVCQVKRLRTWQSVVRWPVPAGGCHWYVYGNRNTYGDYHAHSYSYRGVE